MGVFRMIESFYIGIWSQLVPHRQFLIESIKIWSPTRRTGKKCCAPKESLLLEPPTRTRKFGIIPVFINDFDSSLIGLLVPPHFSRTVSHVRLFRANISWAKQKKHHLVHLFQNFSNISTN